MREAARLSQISTSMIRRMFEIVERAKKEGREIISLTIGEPDFDTPQEVIERACGAMNAGFTHYTSNFGLEELRSAIAERYGVDSSNVMVTAGGSEALLNASLAFIEEGSKVVIPSPNFLSYFTYAKMCGGQIVQLRTHNNGFLPDVEKLNEIIDRNVSVIFLNYPNNPTGAVIDEKDARAVVEIAADNKAIVVSDEIYDQIYYDVKPTSLAGYENVVCVNGFSKSLSMTGWRIGFTIADEKLLDPMLKVHQVNGVCAPAFAQKAVAEVMAERLFDSIVSRMVKEFRQRRDYLYSELSKIYDVVKPEGAFYMFVNVNQDCMEYAENLINLGVAVTPGLPFGDGNETYVRISYANSLENLKKAAEIIREYESQRA
jgi:aspartate aminotransferase